MRVTLDVEAVDGGWTLRVLDAADQPILDPDTQDPLGRVLRQPGDPPEEPLWRFPMPPETEVPALPAGLADSEETLREAYQKILNRDTTGPTVKHFGQYLFTTLLGQDLWGKIRAAAGEGGFELALRWAADDAVLNRYPWEMMHDGHDFLAFLPKVAITRRVVCQGEVSNQVNHPPRVLFVMGTGLDDDVIRPGAEYMSLVRNLIYAGLGSRLQTKVLVRTSTEKLEQAMESFRPTVVHFICHGWFDEETRQPYLELYDQDKKAPRRVYASNMLGLLRAGTPPALPPVVILSACYSANVDEQSENGEPAVPLASALVQGDGQGGIPIVVGMAGRVADQACRLFTRSFYTALLTDQNVAGAVAEGRRTAKDHGGYQPEAEVDWAFPTLFLADAIQESRLTFARLPWLAKTQQAAGRYQDESGFPPFCDRLRVLEQHDLLLADKAAQNAVFVREQVQVLAYSTDYGYDDQEEGPRYGRTWQLKDLAAYAAQEGHIPCVIDKKQLIPGDPWPTTLPDLLRLLDLALEHTAVLFDLLPYNYDNYVQRLLNLNAGAPAPDDFPDELKSRWNRPLAERLARAVRHDLQAFLEKARSEQPDASHRKRIKLLLLFDDLHRMGEEAVRDLLHYVFGDFGLRIAYEDVRIAFTYAQRGKPEWVSTNKAIVDWLGETTWVEHSALESFQQGVEERLAYQRLLLNWRASGQRNGAKKPLTTVVETSVTRPFIEAFFDTLSEETKRIPSFMKEETARMIRIYEKMPVQVLRAANDDDVFAGNQPGGTNP